MIKVKKEYSAYRYVFRHCGKKTVLSLEGLQANMEQNTEE